MRGIWGVYLINGRIFKPSYREISPMRGRTMQGPPVLFKLGIKVYFGQVIKDKSHFSEEWEVRERFRSVSGEVQPSFSAYKKLRY